MKLAIEILNDYHFQKEFEYPVLGLYCCKQEDFSASIVWGSDYIEGTVDDQRKTYL